MLQRIFLAVAFVLAMVTLPGCLTFPGGDKIGVEDVVIKNISVQDGITVSVRGTECQFSFTTDREIIFSEMQKCVIGDETSNGLLLDTVLDMDAKPGSTVPVAPLPQADIDAIHELHQKEIDVDKATAMVIAQIEEMSEEVPVTPQ